MPANGFNIGKDATLDVVSSTSGPLRPTILTDFTFKQMTTGLESKAADGVNRFAEVPTGWEGTLSFDRGNSALDDYVAQAEASYYAGAPGDVITITQTVQEVSGAITQYRYTGVALKYEDAGDWGGEKIVKQKLSWKASRRIKVA